MFTHNNLAKWRKTCSLTQRQLAEACGANRVTIAKLEQGAYNPSLGLALRITQAIGNAVEAKNHSAFRPQVEDIWQL